jgi:hypothetical protein
MSLLLWIVIVILLLPPVVYYLYEYLFVPPSNPGHKRLIDMVPVHSVKDGVLLYMFIYILLIVAFLDLSQKVQKS